MITKKKVSLIAKAIRLMVLGVPISLCEKQLDGLLRIGCKCSNKLVLYIYDKLSARKWRWAELEEDYLNAQEVLQTLLSKD